MPRGGKREGAGAPSQDKITKSFRLRRELVEWLKTQPDQTAVVERGIKTMQEVELGYVRSYHEQSTDAIYTQLAYGFWACVWNGGAGTGQTQEEALKAASNDSWQRIQANQP